MPCRLSNNSNTKLYIQFISYKWVYACEAFVYWKAHMSFDFISVLGMKKQQERKQEATEKKQKINHIILYSVYIRREPCLSFLLRGSFQPVWLEEKEKKKAYTHLHNTWQLPTHKSLNINSYRKKKKTEKEKRSIGKLEDISYLLSHYNYYLTVTHTHWIIKLLSSLGCWVSFFSFFFCLQSVKCVIRIEGTRWENMPCYPSQHHFKIYVLIKC